MTTTFVPLLPSFYEPKNARYFPLTYPSALILCNKSVRTLKIVIDALPRAEKIAIEVIEVR